MRVRVAAVLVALAGCCAFGFAQLDHAAVAKQNYEIYKGRVTAGDLSVDWRAFRLAAIVAGVDGGFDWRAARSEALAAMDAGKDDKALEDAKKIIDHNMANPEGHLLAMMALGKMGRDEDGRRQRAIVDAIVKSIMDSGDGKSAKSAWFTVDPSEEYFVIRVVIGMEPKGQALVGQDGHEFDKMTVVDDKGAEHVFWFNTDTDMHVMAAVMNSKKKK